MPENGNASTFAKDDTAPCVGCGLCCDGTLFNHAVVTPGEEPRLLEHGMELVTSGDRTVFVQPCRYASCGQCTNYTDRFDICRSFRCALLKRYQAGEIDLPEARATVKRALELRSAVKANDPSAVLHMERRMLRPQLAESMKTTAPAERRNLAARLLAMVALDEFLGKRFRRKRAEDQADGPGQMAPPTDG